MWQEFSKGYEKYDFYEGREDIVKDAIERTHDIAWKMCEDVWIDTGAKLPKFGTPEKPAFSMLADLVKNAMVQEGYADKPEYIERVKEELSDIKFLGHEAYFLAMYEIFNKAKERTKNESVAGVKVRSRRDRRKSGRSAKTINKKSTKKSSFNIQSIC